MKYALSILLSLLILNGCTQVKTVLALTRSTDNFLPLKQQPRVKYENGSEKFAEIISQNLDPAVRTIENKQGTFKKQVIVYVPNSIESFTSYCASPYPSACVIGYRLFISPRLIQQKERIPSVLTHELSHLQLTQDIGCWYYQTKLPVWFKEGLAVYMSNGGGAEKVTVQKAVAAIKQRKTITPNGSGSLLFRKTAGSFGLKTHMFYRQSELFVQWLHDLDPGKFKKIFFLLGQGKTLEETFKALYGFSVSQGWKQFICGLKYPKLITGRPKCRFMSIVPPLSADLYKQYREHYQDNG
ncbi:MAG TPA: hypothetical protein ENK84_00010 [Desulfobulbus sp.]|nr:hypothetical protein [Desulfobulbus sp.]